MNEEGWQVKAKRWRICLPQFSNIYDNWMEAMKRLQVVQEYVFGLTRSEGHTYSLDCCHNYQIYFM